MAPAHMQRRIEAFLDKEFGKGATKEEIQKAEDDLKVSFPEDYRFFLSQFGWARFAHEEIYGLGADVPLHLNLVRNTLAERFQMRPHVPHTFIPMMNDGAGNHYCLDSSKKGGPVVFWDHELGENQQPKIVFQDFSSWLVDLLNQIESH